MNLEVIQTQKTQAPEVRRPLQTPEAIHNVIFRISQDMSMMMLSLMMGMRSRSRGGSGVCAGLAGWHGLTACCLIMIIAIHALNVSVSFNGLFCWTSPDLMLVLSCREYYTKYMHAWSRQKDPSSGNSASIMRVHANSASTGGQSNVALLLLVLPVRTIPCLSHNRKTETS